MTAPSLAIVVLGVGSPALAEAPTPPAVETPIETPIETPVETPVETEPPAPPEETDLEDVVDGEAPAPPPEEEPPGGPGRLPAQPCLPGWIWESTKKYTGRHHKGVGVTQANHNATGRTGRSEFISEVAGEVGISVSGKLKAGASVVLAEIEAEYNVELSAKLTARVGNKYVTKTPPRTTTHARYGVYRLKTAGYNQYVYLNCTKGTKQNATVHSPRYIGWYVWETK
ncbi:hypothetical protein [Streptomyces jumonjinensis]|uniref:hypothetical protein n=1 Tax=Streptomyces jumonjinensis TaxID=1945 RepID=UPI0037B01478